MGTELSDKEMEQLAESEEYELNLKAIERIWKHEL